jgi:endonuclease YncB( thermonuclease family)
MKSALTLAVLLLAAVPVLAASGAAAGEIEGKTSVIDGDSLNMQIRLFGIDTPEAVQICKDDQGRDYPCGQVASDALAKLVQD